MTFQIQPHSISRYYTDINECNTNNGGCEHTCTNVDGSNICSCDEGYTLDSNGNSCTGK